MIDEKKLVKEVWKLFGEKYTNAFNFREEETKLAERIMIDVQGLAENQPKIGEWIPCGGRLPEEGKNVILQDYYGDITIARFGRNDLYQDGFYEDDWFSTANNYLAWQPLPEPYKP